MCKLLFGLCGSYTDVTPALSTQTSSTYTLVNYNILGNGGNFVFNTNYQILLSATNVCGWSSRSDYLNFTTFPAPAVPSQMSSPVAETVNNVLVKMTWNYFTMDADTGGYPVTAYELTYALQGYSNWTVLTSSNVNTFSQTTGFNLNSLYNYRLRAYNQLGWGSYSSSTQINTPTTPVTVTGVTVSSISVTQIVLTWNTLTSNSDTGRMPITHYNIMWKLSSDSTYSLVGPSSGLTANTYTITTAFAMNVTLNFQVRAENAVGPGSYSIAISQLTPTVPAKMLVPTSSSIAPTAILVAWTALTQGYDRGYATITNYQLDYQLKDANAWTSVVVQTTTSTSHSITFTSAAYYQYRVRAQNVNGWGPYSDSLTVQADQVPIAMAVPTTTLVEPFNIQVSWTAITLDADIGRDAITYYQLDWDAGTSQGTWTELTAIANGIKLTNLQTVTTVFDQTKVYCYRVRAKNGVGFGPYSPILSITPDKVPTTSPTPSSSSITPTTIVLTWSALTLDADTGGDPITYYKLESDMNDGNGFLEISSLAAGVLLSYSHSATLFPSNTVFNYRIAAMNRVGYGAYSTQLTITTDSVPIKMNAPVSVSVAAMSIVVSWTPLTADNDIGRDAITYIKVEYWPGTGTTWMEISTTGVVTQFTHTLTVPFPPNTNVKYRLTAKNGVGFGPTSDELTVLCDTVPAQIVPAPVVTGDITPVGITFTWTQLTASDSDTGRDPILHYKMVWAVDGTDTWTDLTTYPFIGSTYTVTSGFLKNTLYNIKVAAQNGVGVGTYSDTIQILTDNTPTRMNDPVEDPQTSKSKIVVNWTGISLDEDTGRDPVTYYKLMWDRGSNQWAELTNSGDGLEYTFTKSNQITAGLSYKFKIIAVNRAGEGATSNTITIIPSSVPDKITAPAVTTLANSDVQVKITWTQPVDNGAAITVYDIQIQAKNTSWYQELTGCDGSIAAIVSTKTCYVYMSILRTQFDLLYGNLIVVKVRAYNLKGWQTLYSTVNTVGAVIETEPAQMTAPAKGSNTNHNMLHFTWTALSGTANLGGSTATISSYHIQRNQGNNSIDANDVWTTLTGLSSNDTTLTFQTGTEIVGGTSYRVRVQALNKYGFGTFSPFFTIRCARVPNAPSASLITTTNSSVNVIVSWVAPFNNGLDITKYFFQVRKRDTVTWVNGPSECDMTSPAVVAACQCTIAMSTLRGNTFGLQLNDPVIVKIKAYNDEGYGSYAQNSVGTLIQTVPQQPSVLSNDLTVTTNKRIKLSWPELATLNTWGGIQIITYEITWSDGIFSEAIYNDTQPFNKQYLHVNMNTTPDAGNTPWPTNPIIGGTSYKFKYRAFNIHGAGPYSTETTIIASTKPDQMEPPTTTLTNASVIVSWTVTPDDHERPVTKYRVKFRQSSGTYSEETTQCDGSNALNIANMRCTITMLKLTSAPFSLAIDDLIQAQVEAYNVMGYSNPSTSNTDGVRAKKLPQIAPYNLARGANTGKLQIETTWTALTINAETGGQVVDYKVYWDKGTNNWATLTESTNNQTTFLDNMSAYVTGKSYQFKVAAWNDFGVGPQSAAFTIWAAIPPSGLNEPSTTLSLLTYVIEDDIVVIDWDPPADTGGLAVTYIVEVLSQSGAWLTVNQATECSEKGSISAYVLPQYQTIMAATQCTIMVSNLKTKYLLTIGDTVKARITASHIVGSVSTNSAGSGTAVLPIIPCYRTTFPRVIGGSQDETMINQIDIDDKGNIVAGGYSKDTEFIGKAVVQNIPIAYYIAKGNYYVWAKYIETNDGTGTALYQQVLDVTFRSDGEKMALSLDKQNYDNAYLIVVMNKDGSLFSSYRETTLVRGKINVTSMIFDNSNFITTVVDLSFDGTANRRLSQVVRFSVGLASTVSAAPQFLLQAGNSAKLSQAFCLQKIRTDANTFYVSAMIQDTTTRRPAIVRVAYTSGQISRYLYYAANNPDFASDLKVPVIKRMNLHEDEVGNVHILSACMQAMDGSRMYFGLFNFLTSSFNATIVTPTVSVNQVCLGIFQNEQTIGYALFNDRGSSTASGYMLYYARIRYSTGRLELISVINQDSSNNYGGARFMNPSRIYYWGQSMKINTPTAYSYTKYVGFIHLMDPLEPSTTVATQSFTFSSTGDIKLDTIPVASMTWQSANAPASTGGAWFSNITSGKTFRSQVLSVGISNLNLKSPLSNNTWSPVYSSTTPPTLAAPTVPSSLLIYDPEALIYPIQEVTFNPFIVSRFCPDNVVYYGSFLYDTNTALPTFITFDPSNSRYQLAINQSSHVGTYYITIQATLGNNNTVSAYFTIQVASPCLNVEVNVPTLASVPTYDISDLVYSYIDLNWQVVNPPQNSCGPVNFIFKLLNGTTGATADPTVFTLINTTSGLQRIQIWTQAIPKAKLWTDLKIEARLQGDLVKTYTYTVLITNKCAVTSITTVQQPDIIYYHGRDAIDLQFVWTETVGLCGPITYVALEYITGTPSSNNTLDATVFNYPNIVGTNNTVRIYTADETRAGTYQVRVYASLGVGGYQQSNMIFTVQVIRDPCSYFPFVTSFVDDLTLWVSQSNQIVNIPPFTMNDTNWVCNFTYEIRTISQTTLDPIFITTEVVPQGNGPSVLLSTTDITKTDLSPYTIRIRGWPSRQLSAVSQQYQFRVFISFFVKTDCKSGQYYNSTNDICQACVQPCSTCKSFSECTWCIPGYQLNEVTATCQLNSVDCPNGSIKDTFLGFCRKCPEFCTACSDADTCTACIPNYNLGQGQCFAPRSCAKGFRFENGACLQCLSNCEACTVTSKCTYCMENYFLDSLSGTCTQTCPKGYYGDLYSRTCMVCSPACAACVTNNYTCTECKDIGSTQFYLFKNTCVTRCPYTNYYQNEIERKCDPCKAECKICVNAFDDCIVCNQGSVISGRSCLNSCPAKSYITVIGTCFNCDPACQNCYGPQNSMCTQCVAGQYLTQTTCDPKCNDPFFPDDATRTCKGCVYYCDKCTTSTNCLKCKTGFKQEPNDCSGEWFLKTNTNFSMTVPLNQSLMTDFDPNQATVEIWLRSDNIASLNLEVVLGLSPYKLRKKSGVAQLQLIYGQLSFCESWNLKSSTWYHYAFALQEDGFVMNCYINGDSISTGQTSVTLISSNVERFKEITFGGTNDPKGFESRFNGYLREFRWWNTFRTQFLVKNFMTVGFKDVPKSLYAYWRLDEKKTDLIYKDSSIGGQVYDPSPKLINQLSEMKEIYLKVCPEGFYTEYNETLGYFNCTKCNDMCKNCNGNSSSNCTECNYPYKLIQAEQICVIVDGCPDGYYQDSKTDSCQPCHDYCITCINNPYQCPKCKSQYFKQYKGLGCVDSCPRGLYGNYLTQSCSANPIITSLYPDDNSVFQYGSFIDLTATYQLMNNEPSYSFDIGWSISKLSSQVDLAGDAAKPYNDDDYRRVHLDNNIIEPNNYYNITFYVKGNPRYYNGMLGSTFNVIYIGIPPKNGHCDIYPPVGIAQVTEFWVRTYDWQDTEGINGFHFYYSFDQGETYISFPKSNPKIQETRFKFPSVYQNYKMICKCEVVNMKGFTAFSTTSFMVNKKSTANSKSDLAKLTLDSVKTETDALATAQTIQQLTQDLGQLNAPQLNLFDPKIEQEACLDELCSFGGTCVYRPVEKKYFCKCEGLRAGQNCTFRNKTELQMIKTLIQQLAIKYFSVLDIPNRNYEYEFMKLTSAQVDLMNDDMVDLMYPIVYKMAQNLDITTLDTIQAQEYLQILSNMVEYIQYDLLVNNVTGSWKNGTKNASEKQDWVNEQLNKTMGVVKMIMNKTLYQLSFLNTQIQIQTRTLSYRQILANQDQILSIPGASDGLKKSSQSFVKISQTNFLNSSVNLNDQFIAQIAEYSINPFQQANVDSLASNVLSIELFNQNRTSVSNTITKVNVTNLTNPIELSFSAADSQNLSLFVKQYGQLSPFKNSDRLKRDEMIFKSGIACVYWTGTEWSKRGCVVSGVDITHIKCQCNHLTSFAVQFFTPKLSVDSPMLENSTTQAGGSATTELAVDDIVRWPLDAYFARLQEIWQHNRPTFINFILKPGAIVLGLFWAMYFSSLIYYSGRDALKRDSMTKAQNRDDLAELQDDETQNLHQVIKDLIVRDFFKENERFIKKQQLNKDGRIREPPKMIIYEELSREDRKKYKQRARAKVFGIPAGLWDRARRIYEKTMNHNKNNPNAKMSFFNEELKNNLWIGLIAKTSKIAPRHIRLTLMYFYSALHITVLTIVFAFQLQEYISSNALFQVVVLSFLTVPLVWLITIPVARIFSMPLQYRRLIAGVRTKKINKAFKEVDKLMGTRYAVGYFICYAMYAGMTVIVLVFNTFYPRDYVMGWAFNIILLYMFDLIVFTFALASIQMANIMIAEKVKGWYYVWATIEVFRYLKNLRG